MTRPPPADRRIPLRGDVWLAALDATEGSEIQKTRPCLIVSPPELNRVLRTAIVVPLTTGGRSALFRVPVRFQGKDARILCEQMRALDRDRFVQRLGAVSAQTLAATLAVMQDIFAD